MGISTFRRNLMAWKFADIDALEISKETLESLIICQYRNVAVVA